MHYSERIVDICEFLNVGIPEAKKLDLHVNKLSIKSGYTREYIVEILYQSTIEGCTFTELINILTISRGYHRF